MMYKVSYHPLIRTIQYLCKKLAACVLDTYIALKLHFSKRLQHERAMHQQQNQYLLNHIDPAKLKPATGELREFQLRLLNYCYTLIQQFEQQGIEYFLTSGNLLGALRHRGYIPWDDDFDIAMMRPDYEKCINYARHKFVNIDTSHLPAFRGGSAYYRTIYELWDRYIKQYPNQTLYFQYGEHTQLIAGTSIADCVNLDIFVYDFYDDAYTLEEHKTYLAKLKQQEKQINDVAKIYDYFRQEAKTNPHVVQRSNKIFAGPGCSEGWQAVESAQFLTYDQIYPLKKLPFEDKYLSVPNDAVAFVTNLYGKNWNKLPSMVGEDVAHRSFRSGCTSK